MFLNKKAFTLGELLMALGIIGVISVLIMPQIVAGRLSSQAKSEFNTAYANISRAISEMESDDITASDTKYSTENSFYPVLKKYFNVVYDCGSNIPSGPNQVCLSSSDAGKYSTVDGRSISKSNYTLFDNGSFVTNNGMLIMIENGSNSAGNPYGLLISVDINGKSKPPNKYGWDLFTFEVSDGQIIPAGATGSKYEAWRDEPQKYCDTSSSEVPIEQAGVTCSYYALSNDDYFKERYNRR